MSNTGSELERWLSGGEFLASGGEADEHWEPGFEVDRQVVFSRLGNLYQKVFLRPDNFVQRFFHQVYSLPIEDWHFQEQIELYDGFCHIDVDLELRYQATLKYVQRNFDFVEQINQQIQQNFRSILTDIVHEEIYRLGDGAWVQNGLSETEKMIATAIDELLMTQNVQSRTICRPNACFDEFPNIQPGRDRVFLHALKKSHEITEQKNRAFFLQQQALKEQKLAQKKEQLEQLRKLAELERQKKRQEAENKLVLLQEQEKQLAAQLVVEKRIYAEKIKHQNQLKEMEFEAELQIQQKQNSKQRLADSQNLTEVLEHQAQVEDMKSRADLLRRQKQQSFQTQIHQSKTQAEIERYETQQETWRQAKLRIHEQQLALKKRQKQLEAEAEEAFKQCQKEEKEKYLVMPFQKLDKFDDEGNPRKKSEALRNEIELAVLEKQRLDLEMAIKEAQQNSLTG